MSAIYAAAEAALKEAAAAKKRITKVRHSQITKVDIIDYLKSISHSWHRTHRPKLVTAIEAERLSSVDKAFGRVMDATGRASAKSTYVASLNQAIEGLIAVRTEALSRQDLPIAFNEPPPNFSKLANDPAMQEILGRRWEECKKCLRVDAHLAATVMMGGFLEALFVAKANMLSDKKALFTAKAAPVDKHTGKAAFLRSWTLGNYIDVAAELKWISRPGKDFASVLREYRNYVHPEKERSHGVNITEDDPPMFWELTKSLTLQLLKS